MKLLRYILEFILVRCFVLLFSLLPAKAASSLGGRIGRIIGPHIAATRTARRNLARALPMLSIAEQQQTITGMWEHLGRVAAEFVHIHKPGFVFFEQYVTINGAEHLEKIARGGEGALMFSGHIGNWELLPKIAEYYHVPLAFIYRPANNPFVDKLICGIRAASQSAMLPKGSKGARELIVAIKEGKTIAMLVDQKMNSGIAVPFFGREAMTAPALAKLAYKMELPVIPVHVKRQEGMRFTVDILPPLPLVRSGDAQQDVYHLMAQVNRLFEEWIKEAPEQWFWVHKRWPEG